MRLWPPLLWPVMSFASLLILIGLGPWDPVALTIGVGLAVAVFAVSLYIATRRLRDRRRPSGFGWVIAAVTAFYAVATAVAATLGPAYAIAALLAGLIPLSARPDSCSRRRASRAPSRPAGRGMPPPPIIATVAGPGRRRHRRAGPQYAFGRPGHRGGGNASSRSARSGAVRWRSSAARVSLAS